MVFDQNGFKCYLSGEFQKTPQDPVYLNEGQKTFNFLEIFSKYFDMSKLCICQHVRLLLC